MIQNFKHKGLQEAFSTGQSKKLPPEHLRNIKLILTAIHNAQDKKDLNIPGRRLHLLKGALKGYLSLDITRNFRIIFEFEKGIAKNVDFLDTH